MLSSESKAHTAEALEIEDLTSYVLDMEIHQNAQNARQHHNKNYVNDYRKPILFNCPANQVVAGVESVHNNSPEDRVWKFRCCTSFQHATTNCELTDYINNLHGNFDYTVPGSKVVVGMYSTWVNK